MLVVGGWYIGGYNGGGRTDKGDACGTCSGGNMPGGGKGELKPLVGCSRVPSE